MKKIIQFQIDSSSASLVIGFREIFLRWLFKEIESIFGLWNDRMRLLTSQKEYYVYIDRDRERKTLGMAALRRNEKW